MKSDFEVNTWHLVTLTKKARLYSLYINDQLDQTLTAPVDFSLKTGIKIGDTSAGDGNFFGKLDEVKIFGHALTPVEIAELYNAGQLPSTDQAWLTIRVDTVMQS